MPKTLSGRNITNIYRVRTGWYLQLQWAGRVYRELFSDSRYGGQSGALDKAIVCRNWLDKFRVEFEQTVVRFSVANQSDDMEAYEAAARWLTAEIREQCRTSRDRALFNEYFSLEPSYVPA